MEYKDESGAATGVAVDMIKEIFERMNQDISIEIHDWQTSLGKVKSGQADGIFTIYKAADRQDFIAYSKHIIIQQPIALYTKVGAKITFNGDLETLKERRFAVIPKMNYGHVFEQAKVKHQFKTVESADLKSSFKLLKMGKVDFVVSSFFPAQKFLNVKKGHEKFSLSNHPVDVTPSYFGFSKNKSLDPIRLEFDRQLAAYRKKNEHLNLLKKYNLSLPKNFISNYRPKK